MSDLKHAPLRDLANNLLNIDLNGWFKNIFYSSSNPIITGSYIYKFLLRDEKIEDIDIIVEDLERSKNVFGRHYKRFGFRYPFPGYRIDFDRKDGVYLDVIGYNTYLNVVAINGLTPVNSLILSKDGIKHIYDSKSLRERFWIPEDLDPIKERDWMVDNFKKGRYCKWSRMREKDIEYFSDFDVIDEQECECHFIFNR